jgi:ribosomal protein L37AE/L43A
MPNNYNFGNNGANAGGSGGYDWSNNLGASSYSYYVGQSVTANNNNYIASGLKVGMFAIINQINTQGNGICQYTLEFNDSMGCKMYVVVEEKDIAPYGGTVSDGVLNTTAENPIADDSGMTADLRHSYTSYMPSPKCPTCSSKSVFPADISKTGSELFLVWSCASCRISFQGRSWESGNELNTMLHRPDFYNERQEVTEANTKIIEANNKILNLELTIDKLVNTISIIQQDLQGRDMNLDNLRARVRNFRIERHNVFNPLPYDPTKRAAIENELPLPKPIDPAEPQQYESIKDFHEHNHTGMDDLH